MSILTKLSLSILILFSSSLIVSSDELIIDKNSKFVCTKNYNTDNQSLFEVEIFLLLRCSNVYKPNDNCYVKKVYDDEFTISYFDIDVDNLDSSPMIIVLKQTVKSIENEFYIEEWLSVVDVESKYSKTEESELKCLQISGEKPSIKLQLDWLDNFNKQTK